MAYVLRLGLTASAPVHLRPCSLEFLQKPGENKRAGKGKETRTLGVQIRRRTLTMEGVVAFISQTSSHLLPRAPLVFIIFQTLRNVQL